MRTFMGSGLNILGLVPARGGSKGVVGKNLREVGGKALVGWAIETGLASEMVGRVLVSTDSEEIADVAKGYGGDVPFIRPPELGGDETGMIDVVRHAVGWVWEEEGVGVDVVVLLQPTAPFRRGRDVDGALGVMMEAEADGVVSVVRVEDHFNAYWQVERLDREGHPPTVLPPGGVGALQLVVEGGELRGIVRRRQDLPVTYIRNGAIYGVRVEAMERTGSLYGGRCVGYEMDFEGAINIDREEDLARAEGYIKKFLEGGGIGGVDG